jgi:hypothetical protein
VKSPHRGSSLARLTMLPSSLQICVLNSIPFLLCSRLTPEPAAGTLHVRAYYKENQNRKRRQKQNPSTPLYDAQCRQLVIKHISHYEMQGLHHRHERALSVGHGLDIGMGNCVKHDVVQLVVRPNIYVGTFVASVVNIIRSREHWKLLVLSVILTKGVSLPVMHLPLCSTS